MESPGRNTTQRMPEVNVVVEEAAAARISWRELKVIALERTDEEILLSSNATYWRKQ